MNQNEHISLIDNMSKSSTIEKRFKNIINSSKHFHIVPNESVCSIVLTFENEFVQISVRIFDNLF